MNAGESPSVPGASPGRFIRSALRGANKGIDMTTKTKRSEKEESAAELRKLLKPGDTVYTVLRHVSRSGMMRRIDLYVVKKGEPRYITYYVGKVLEYKRSRDKEGLSVGGCGMDMGFHLVHSLGYALWGAIARDGTGSRATAIRKAIRKASGHYLMQGGRTEEPDPAQPAGEWFGAAGYALKHSWI